MAGIKPLKRGKKFVFVVMFVLFLIPSTLEINRHQLLSLSGVIKYIHPKKSSPIYVMFKKRAGAFYPVRLVVFDPIKRVLRVF